MSTTDENTTTPPASQEAAAAAVAAGGVTELATLKADLAALGEQVAHMAGLVIADVPERFKALIPEGLSPAAQAAWALKARQAGLFGPVTVPATDAGRKPTVTPKATDYNSLPPIARIAAGYRTR
jgi:hypothetical protein